MMMMMMPIPYSSTLLPLLHLLLLLTSTLFLHINASPTLTSQNQNQDQDQDPAYPFGPLNVIIQYTRPGGETSFADLNNQGTTTEDFSNRDDVAILSLKPTLDFEYADADAINADPVPFTYFVDVNDYSKSPVSMSMVKIVYGRADVRCTVEAAGAAAAAAGGSGIGGEGAQASWELRAGEGLVELAGSAGTGGDGVDVARIVCSAGKVEMYSEL